VTKRSYVTSCHFSEPRQHAGISLWSKNGFFAPQGQHIAQINGLLLVPNLTFISAEVWEYSLRNSQNRNFAHKFASRTIFTKLSTFVRIYRYPLRF